jgi:hypothetical protein
VLILFLAHICDASRFALKYMCDTCGLRDLIPDKLCYEKKLYASCHYCNLLPLCCTGIAFSFA